MELADWWERFARAGHDERAAMLEPETDGPARKRRRRRRKHPRVPPKGPRASENHPGSLAFVALGANLGAAAETLRSAASSLDHLPETRVVARSSIYRTAPIGVGEQPDYFNSVVQLETCLDPRSLLDALLATEAEHGRVRLLPMAARTLDLDLLLYDQLTIDEPDLRVPHPRMHLRAFVLHPLHEIAPDLYIPGHGLLGELLAQVADQRISKLPG